MKKIFLLFISVCFCLSACKHDEPAFNHHISITKFLVGTKEVEEATPQYERIFFNVLESVIIDQQHVLLFAQ